MPAAWADADMSMTAATSEMVSIEDEEGKRKEGKE